MYITINSIKKTLGKYIEITDLYIGISMLIIFLSMFSFMSNKMISLIFLTTCIFLMLPINLSKKNRMYKVMWLFIKYLFKEKEYIFLNDTKGR